MLLEGLEITKTALNNFQRRFVFLENHLSSTVMNPATLTNKINALPAGLQKQVADFVEFLLLKYRIQSDEESTLTPEQKKELLELWKSYEENPDDVLTIEMLREQTNAK